MTQQQLSREITDFAFWQHTENECDRGYVRSGNSVMRRALEELQEKETHKMKPRSDLTAVMFRVWRKANGGGVIALFPYEPYDSAGWFCSSFEHVGQHGGADYKGVIQCTRPATPEEYARLKQELEQPPYEYQLRVIRRATPRRA